MKTPDAIQNLLERCEIIVDNDITHGSVDRDEAEEVLDWWERVTHPPVIMQLVPYTHYEPRCPFCSQKMVAARIELPDRTVLCWLCRCTDGDRDNIRKEVKEDEYALGNAG